MNQQCMVYISIAAIIMAVLYVGYRKWKSQRAAKLFKATLPNTLTSVNDPQMVSHSIVLCNNAIISGIDSMLSLSAIDACRNNRLFDTLYSGYDMFRKSDISAAGNEDLNHIWNTGLKITEITRSTAVFTETHLTEREKIDIAEVRDDIIALSDAISRALTDNNSIKSGASSVKESVSTHIRRYTNSMNHNDYNDGSVRYSYLRLLHNLYSYFLSIQKIA